MNLGVFPSLSLAEARKEALNKLTLIHKGQDPADEKRRYKLAESFEELAEQFMRNAEGELSAETLRGYRGMLKRDLLPRWGRRKLSEIVRADVIKLLDDITFGRGSPIMANRTRELVHRLFTYAISRGLVESNPVAGVEKPARERKGERVFSEDEIRLFWELTEAETPTYRAYFRLLLLTGQRKSELLKMEWAHIDGHLLNIPSKHTKSGRKHQIFLTRTALYELEQLRLHSGASSFVFPGKDNSKPMVEPRRGYERLLKRMDTASRWSLHDLRRTVQTRMAEIGVSPDVIDRVVNHQIRGVRAHYDRHSYTPEIRKALIAWDKRLGEIVDGEQVKRVLPLRSTQNG